MELINRVGLVAVLLAFTVVGVTYAADPDILSNFVVPLSQNSTNLDGSFFTFTGFREDVKNSNSSMGAVKVTKASMSEFPVLTGLGVSMPVLQFPSLTVNPLHIHPRAFKLLFLTTKTLLVRVVDTAGKLYTQNLFAGDLFVFPKGFLHFQMNTKESYEAVSISAFGSASVGTVSMPCALFGTNIKEDVLAKSFKTDVQTVQALKAALTPKP